MQKKAKKKLNTLDRYIILSIVLIVIYTIAHTIIFAVTQQEAKVLDTLFYSTFGLEILYCFLIKRFKLHDEAKDVLKKKEEDVGETWDE